MIVLYTKIVVLLCAVSVISAAVVYLVFLLSGLLLGDIAISATRTGWTLLLFGWWTSSFFLGIRLAVALQMFPFSLPK